MWFRSLFDVVIACSSQTSVRPKRHATKDPQRPRSFRPHLDILEDRTLPSTFTVTNLLDSGPGSLRAAVAAANANPGADVINVATTGTIALTSGELDITDSLTINGPGLNSLTVSGNHVSRVFGLAANPTVSIADLTVANGATSGSPGGGIYMAGGNLALNRVALSGNIAYSDSNGGQGAGGGLYVAGGTLTLDHITLSGNVAHGTDGYDYPVGQYVSAGSAAGGGLYVAGGMVYVNQSTFSSNQAVGGSGNPANACDGPTTAGDGLQGNGGGLYVAGGTVSIDNSTFSANEARGGDGGGGDSCTDGPPGNYSAAGNGGLAAGGGIRVAAGTVTVQHSTLSGNFATGGLGGAAFDIAPPGVDGVGSGGGISNAGGLQMFDTILAGNSANSAPDLDGALTSLGHNLVGNTTGGSGFAASDLLNVNPRLGPLQNNGGPTQTMALLAGSPAIDAGDSSGAPTYDQRGPGFLRIVNGSIDIGAFEVQNGSPSYASSLAVAGFPTVTTAGNSGSFTVTALNADGTTDTSYTGTVHFSSSDGQAGLPADYTFTAADAGVHTFSATLKTAGTQSITAGDSSTFGLTGTDAGITVNAAAARSMTVAGFPSTATAGVAGYITVTLRDPYGNVASGHIGTVHFTSSDTKASLPANYTFTAADAGVHAFSATLKTAGTQSITATDTMIPALTSSESGITVNAAAASKIIISAPSSVSAGVAFSLTLTVEDAYGNVVTGYTGTVHFSSTDNKATLPKNYTFAAADKGVHTFTGLVLRKKGNQKITIADTLNSSLTASVIENVP
jgi:hypothetical protein